MDEQPVSVSPHRRRILVGIVGVFAGLGGCLDANYGERPTDGPPDRQADEGGVDGYGRGAYSITPYGAIKPT